MIIPLAEDVSAFSERFGVDVYTLFNMSEVSAPIVSELNPHSSLAPAGGGRGPRRR
jgi:crotonobetaine/carnitine-CoA ligase